jgi:hypothetical protein
VSSSELDETYVEVNAPSKVKVALRFGNDEALDVIDEYADS